MSDEFLELPELFTWLGVWIYTLLTVATVDDIVVSNNLIGFVSSIGNEELDVIWRFGIVRVVLLYDLLLHFRTESLSILLWFSEEGAVKQVVREDVLAEGRGAG